jgi:hypothetical protein
MNPVEELIQAAVAKATEGSVEKTPSQKAWETARLQAREQGQTVRDDEIRAIKSRFLSVWAKLLFWIISKICWESSPFLHDRRIGSVCITGRQLKTHYGFPQKRLYAQTKRKKDKTGAVISTRKVPGAIEELETAGLVWMSHKPIQNIPTNKWPNVFNLTALVPQRLQQNLSLLEGVVVVEEETATDGGSSDFSAENPGGSGQTPQKGLGCNQRGVLPATDGGSSQAPLAGVGKNRRGDLARTDGGSSAATDGGSSQEPTGVAAYSRWRGLPTPASGAPLTRLSDVTGKTDSPDSSLSDYADRSKGKELLKRKGGEKGFLAQVAFVIARWSPQEAEKELLEWGGWWTNRFREDADKVRRVLAEVESMIRESRIKVTPGKAAQDLWKRFA